MKDYSSTECPDDCSQCRHFDECLIPNSDDEPVVSVKVDPQTEIDQLRQRAAKVEAENTLLQKTAKSAEDNAILNSTKLIKVHAALAASQLREKQLREALVAEITLDAIGHEDLCRYWTEPELCTCGSTDYHRIHKALAIPQDDSALREYVAGKVKPLVEALSAACNPLLERHEIKRICDEALEAAIKERTPPAIANIDKLLEK